mgnify:CR=1 FL=1
MGIKRQTLYAYVSRGLLESTPKGGPTREHLYRREDIERLKARHAARSGHGAVAASALRWGEPVLESAITKVSDGELHYRGQSATELARRQMKLPGGMVAFELKGGIEAGRRFMNALQLITRAVSLGDAESLAQHPASMTHSFYTPEERREHLIGEGLVRISAGLEDPEDLLDDVRQALAAARQMTGRDDPAAHVLPEEAS